MQYNEDLIRWYMNSKVVEDLKAINTVRKCTTPANFATDFDYAKMEDEYFGLMPACNLTSDTHMITFENSGTDFIKQIFEQEVDDDTLVVSTKYEHNSVVDELKECKHVLLLDYNNDILNRGLHFDALIDKMTGYKKVFVYVIGTQISTGQITPQGFFVDLKEELEKRNIKHKILLDDVHGMFMVPRDYSLFDYVLYTAHAIIPEFNMGMLISKNGEYGYKAYNWGVEYLPKLKKLLANKTELMQFKTIMTEYFYHFLCRPELSLYPHSVNHIFAFRTENLYFTDAHYEELKEYGITLSEHHTPISFVRIRFQEFLLQDPEKAIEGLNKLNTILTRMITLAQLKGY